MDKARTGRLIISACMMVRDEEENLPRCLDSIKDVVDEIVVVDTGSIDKTVEIAKSYGARVYHHPWENDFSKHRNQSISYAKGDWILIIDADEELFLEHSIDELRDFLKSTTTKCVSVILNDIADNRIVLEFNSFRFFRKGCIRYEGAVHNQACVEDGNSGILEPYVKIRHYGYDLPPAKKEKKYKRTVGLLMEGLKKNPENWQYHFYLNQIYATRNEVDKAIESGLIYIKHKQDLLKNGRNVYNTSIYFTMTKMFVEKSDFENAKMILQMGMQDIPDDIDMAFAMVEVGHRFGQFDYIVLGMKKYVEAYNLIIKDPLAKKNRFIHTFNNIAYTACLFHHCISCLNEGKSALEQLLGMIRKDVTPEHRKNMQEDIRHALRVIGFDDLFPDAKVVPFRGREVPEKKRQFQIKRYGG